MTSDERLVSQVALELLRANSAIEPIVQLAIGDDEEELTLPVAVISAKFESEESGSTLPKKYALTIEIRGLKRQHPGPTMDEIFAQIGSTLCPTGENSLTTSVPPTITSSFSWFRIEAQSGAESTQGEVNSRSKTYSVFASLL